MALTISNMYQQLDTKAIGKNKETAESRIKAQAQECMFQSRVSLLIANQSLRLLPRLS
jgi:hypothetical protein